MRAEVVGNLGSGPRKAGAGLALLGAVLMLSAGASMALESTLQRASAAATATPATTATAVTAVDSTVLAPLTTAAAGDSAAPAAQRQQGTGNARDKQIAASQMSRSQVVTLAQRRYRARVVRSHALQGQGRALYEVRLLSASGRVWTVHIDAINGTEVPY